jgi:hypothetical protein
MTQADKGQDKPQGPVDPHGPGGQDAPAPPGGPLRTDDAPASAPTPGTPAQDPGPSVERVSKPDDDQTPDDVPAPTHEGGAEQDADERALQEENAETSLDQPSG